MFRIKIMHKIRVMAGILILFGDGFRVRVRKKVIAIVCWAQLIVWRFLYCIRKAS